jgi:hypothetical protein
MKYLKLFENFPTVPDPSRPRINTSYKDSSTANLEGLKLNGNKFSMSDVIESKQYVYKYNYNGKDLFYYKDGYFDRGPDKALFYAVLGSDINDARRFTGKQVKEKFWQRKGSNFLIGGTPVDLTKEIDKDRKFQGSNNFWEYSPEMYCEEEGGFISLDENPDIIEA